MNPLKRSSSARGNAKDNLDSTSIQLVDNEMQGHDLVGFARKVSEVVSQHKQLDQQLTDFVKHLAVMTRYPLTLKQHWERLSDKMDERESVTEYIQDSQLEVAVALEERRGELLRFTNDLNFCIGLVNNCTKVVQAQFLTLSEEFSAPLQPVIFSGDDFHNEEFDDLLREHTLTLRSHVNDLMVGVQKLTSDPEGDPHKRRDSLKMQYENPHARVIGELARFHDETVKVEDKLIKSPLKTKLTTAFYEVDQLRREDRVLMQEISDLEDVVKEREGSYHSDDKIRKTMSSAFLSNLHLMVTGIKELFQSSDMHSMLVQKKEGEPNYQGSIQDEISSFSSRLELIDSLHKKIITEKDLEVLQPMLQELGNTAHWLSFQAFEEEKAEHPLFTDPSEKTYQDWKKKGWGKARYKLPNLSEYSVRFAEFEDYKKVLEISNDHYDEKWDLSALYSFIEEYGLKTRVVANNKGEVVGYMQYEDHIHSYNLLEVVVAKDYRRQGIGALMVNELILVLEDILGEAKEMTAEIRDSNKDAPKFFFACGLHAVSSIRDAYDRATKSESAIIMLLDHKGLEFLSDKR